MPGLCFGAGYLPSRLICIYGWVVIMLPAGAVPCSLPRKAEGALSFPQGEGGGKQQKRNVPLLMLQETDPSVQNCKGGFPCLQKEKKKN